MYRFPVSCEMKRRLSWFTKVGYSLKIHVNVRSVGKEDKDKQRCFVWDVLEQGCRNDHAVSTVKRFRPPEGEKCGESCYGENRNREGSRTNATIWTNYKWPFVTKDIWEMLGLVESSQFPRLASNINNKHFITSITQIHRLCQKLQMVYYRYYYMTYCI